MKRRLEKVRERLEALQIDAFILTYLPHIRYLVGFTGSNGLLLIKKEETYFFTDFRYKEQSKQEIPEFVETIITGDLLQEAVKRISDKERVGFDSNHISFANYKRLKEVLKREPNPVDDFIYELRMKKERKEIESIRRSQKIVDEVFNEVLTLQSIGSTTEKELAALIEYNMKKKGAEGASFPSIVASGSNSALPHAKPRNVEIGRNTMLLLDYGAFLDGYASDMTRTVWIGKKPAPKFLEIYNVVLDAVRITEDKAKPGMKGKEIDALARDYISKKGYGDYFGHGLGHGVGVEVHEKPGVHPKSEDIVEPGMVFTIEPGIYIPDFGGVRIEDLVVMRDGGVEILTGSPKELLLIEEV